MGSKLLLGTFNIERLWQGNDQASLFPHNSLAKDQSLFCLDEMLFVYCTENTKLLTSLPINQPFQEYLDELGFVFVNIFPDSVEEFTSTSDYLLQTDNSDFLNLLSGVIDIDFYAYDPMSKDIVDRYIPSKTVPRYNIVRKVNSKEYSKNLCNAVTSYPYGTFVNSTESLLEEGKELLNLHPKVILKESYGVSGKGSLIVETEKSLQVIARKYRKQENLGKEIGVCVEPYLSKKTDFSCHFKLLPDGSKIYIGIREMHNSRFKFQRIGCVSERIKNRLDSGDYFNQMNSVVDHMYSAGYHGDICIDSMVLENNDLVPLVEINARKSMGQISIVLDSFLEKYGRGAAIMLWNLSCKELVSFHQILLHLDESNLLFSQKRLYGVLPLSASLFEMPLRSKGPKEIPYSTSLYFGLVSDENQTNEDLALKFSQLLNGLKITVLP